mmetsp:Transcript_9718/g.17474  ORF Transcript_9718/g.17474 Transcript_9718/m.17474 type:complete len:247 (-) Transcript_9718:485-1225(-)
MPLRRLAFKKRSARGRLLHSLRGLLGIRDWLVSQQKKGRSRWRRNSTLKRSHGLEILRLTAVLPSTATALPRSSTLCQKIATGRITAVAECRLCRRSTKLPLDLTRTRRDLSGMSMASLVVTRQRLHRPTWRSIRSTWKWRVPPIAEFAQLVLHTRRTPARLQVSPRFARQGSMLLAVVQKLVPRKSWARWALPPQMSIGSFQAPCRAWEIQISSWRSCLVLADLARCALARFTECPSTSETWMWT